MRILTVRHATTYRYARPVTFGQHRLMLRPRDSHDLRLVAAELTLSPPGNLRWMHDVFGNSVALVDFNASAAMLRSESNGTASMDCNFPSHRRRNFIPSSIRAAITSIWADCWNSTTPIRTAFWRAGRTAS
jgi:Bacterial transglutaminase-like N-terminal region